MGLIDCHTFAFFKTVLVRRYRITNVSENAHDSKCEFLNFQNHNTPTKKAKVPSNVPVAKVTKLFIFKIWKDTLNLMIQFILIGIPQICYYLLNSYSGLMKINFFRSCVKKLTGCIKIKTISFFCIQNISSWNNS